MHYILLLWDEQSSNPGTLLLVCDDSDYTIEIALTKENKSIDMSNYNIKLQCLIIPREESVRHFLSRFSIITIDILAKDNSIGDLKNAIYAENRTAFTHFSSHQLVLSLVSISCNELIKLNEKTDAYTTILSSKKRELLHVEELASIFPKEDLPKPGYVHVLVEQPIYESSYELREKQRKNQIITNDLIRVSTANTYTTTETSVVIDPLLRQELGHVMHRNVDNFFDAFFPTTQTHERIEGIMKECTNNGKWNNSWIGLPKTRSKEAEYYQSFVSLTNYIIGQFNSASPIKFLVHANYCPIQDRVGAVSRKPDIVLVNNHHIIRDNRKEIVRWRNIHVIGEIKRSYQSDNLTTDLELASYVRELFGNQPNRRFVFGFTLCETLMRVWLFDRSGCISSKSFNIHRDPHLFVRVIIGFANMDKSQLGYDPTIMYWPDRIGCIEIKKLAEQESDHEKTERFVLIEKLHHRAVICGRGTVCWKAYRLDENGDEIKNKEYVIKDSWRAISRKTIEGDLLKKASVALKLVENSRVVEYYHHEDVTLLNTVQEKIVDDTLVCIRKSLRLPFDFDNNNNKVFSQQTQYASYIPSDCPNIYSECSSNNFETNSQTSIGSKSSGSRKQVVQLREPEYRIHTRLISATSGRPIYYFNDQTQLLTVFYDAIEGHRNLFQTASILHRDVSLYNIMIGADGRGFIIDLDYAIELSESNEKKSAQCHRTGTLPFMAIDILLHDDEHHFRHDLESFFYVLCWICCECEGPHGLLRSDNCDRKTLRIWMEGSPETIGTLFENGALKHNISHEVILQLFAEEIQRRQGDENLTTDFESLNI